jgi:hypothetical protein
VSAEQVDLDDFWSMREIASFFPLKFADKKQWTEITGQCAGCKEDILVTHLRGRIERVDAHTYAMRASGYCASCNVITRFAYLLHDDMSITGASSGRIARWVPGDGLRELQ